MSDEPQLWADEHTESIEHMLRALGIHEHTTEPEVGNNEDEPPAPPHPTIDPRFALTPKEITDGINGLAYVRAAHAEATTTRPSWSKQARDKAAKTKAATEANP